MKHINGIKTLFFAVVFIIMAGSCNNGKGKDSQKLKTDTIVRTEVKVEQKNLTNKATVINITDTLSNKAMVLCLKDSAANSGRISKKLGEIYSVKLALFIKRNGLKITGPPMAWYKSEKAPYFFEAGYPIDKRPKKLPAGATIKLIGIDSVVVAHFYGPYNLTNQAYIALNGWMKDHKKKLSQPSYEVYVDEPIDKTGKLKDPYKVLTDIVFTWK